MNNITDDLRALHREVFVAVSQGLSAKLYGVQGYDGGIVLEAHRVAIAAIDFWPGIQKERDEAITRAIKETQP